MKHLGGSVEAEFNIFKYIFYKNHPCRAHNRRVIQIGFKMGFKVHTYTQRNLKVHVGVLDKKIRFASSLLINISKLHTLSYLD